MVSQTNINAFTDISRFGTLRSEAGKNPNGSVSQVAQEFEALFIEMMLSTARNASLKGGMFESHALELYQEMFDTQAARVLSEQGTLGFEQAISQFAGIVAEQEPTRNVDEVSEGARNNDLTVPARRADLPLLDRLSRSSPPSEKAVPYHPLSEAKIINSVVAHDQVFVPKTAGTTHSEQLNFSQAMAPFANVAAKKLGTEPAILIAQAALETGWGAHIIPDDSGGSSNNLFGIKANNRWDGAASEVSTLEFLGDRPIRTRASFRSYPDIESAFEDYVQFITENPRYQGALSKAANSDSYIRELEKAGYATDPNYAAKIISIKNRIESMNMLANAEPKMQSGSTNDANK